jgi:hypothetical protein
MKLTTFQLTTSTAVTLGSGQLRLLAGSAPYHRAVTLAPQNALLPSPRHPVFAFRVFKVTR